MEPIFFDRRSDGPRLGEPHPTLPTTVRGIIWAAIPLCRAPGKNRILSLSPLQERSCDPRVLWKIETFSAVYLSARSIRFSAARFAEITGEFDGVSFSIVNQKVAGSYDLIAQPHPGDAKLLGAIPT